MTVSAESICTCASFPKDLDSRMAEILAPYRGEKGELIPLLQRAQQEFGYLPEPVMKQVNQATRISR